MKAPDTHDKGNESVKVGHNSMNMNALIASEIRYRRLFETAKEGILILDAETGKIVDVNPFFNATYAISKQEK